MRARPLGAIVAGLAAGLGLSAGSVVMPGPASASPRTYAVPDPTAQLKPPRGGPDGPQVQGYEAAQANCQTCHSVDYIATQPPGRGKAFWDAEVSKMIKAYHAPIAEADGRAIAAYLSDTY